MIRRGAAALAVVLGASAAQAAALTPTDIVHRHTASGGNIDAIMQDYADDAVVFQAGRAIQGKEAIRALFARMFPPRPAGAPAGAAPGGRPAGGGMTVTRVWQEGDVGFMTWTAGPIKATEEFLVRDGKIAVQAIFMSGMPQPPAAK